MDINWMSIFSTSVNIALWIIILRFLMKLVKYILKKIGKDKK